MPPQNHNDSSKQSEVPTEEPQKTTTHMPGSNTVVRPETEAKSDEKLTETGFWDSSVLLPQPPRWDEEGGTTCPVKNEADEDSSSSGRERLKRHRMEVSGRVWIPEIWGHEDFLKDWIDCTAFDSSLVNTAIMSARAALIKDGRKSNSTSIFTIQN